MAAPVDNLAHNLAHNLTAMRRRRQLSQAKLAAIAGIPRSTVTHMESGAGNPSLANLARVAGALQASMEDLLARPHDSVILLGAAQVPVKTAGRAKVFKLLPQRVGALELDRFELRPGGSLPGAPHTKGTLEYLYGLKGAVQVLVGGETYRVGAGDLLSFPADQPHSYRNAERSIAELLSVVVPIPLSR